MKTATCHLVGTSPYSSSRPFTSERDEQAGETHDAFDKRCWRERLSLASDGSVVIPFMGFKMALSAAAKLTQRKLKGAQTYAKTMDTGILLSDSMRLEINPKDVRGDPIYCNADGVRGSGKRVWRIYPMIMPWKGTIVCHLINPAIEPAIFEKYLEEAGQFIGVGRFRPEKGGINGRWSVQKVTWSE